MFGNDLDNEGTIISNCQGMYIGIYFTSLHQLSGSYSGSIL